MIDLSELASAAKRKEDDKYRRQVRHVRLRYGALNFMHGRFAERPLSFKRALELYFPAFVEFFQRKYENAKVTVESGFEDPIAFDVDFEMPHELSRQEYERITANLQFDIADINEMLEANPSLWYTTNRGK